MSEQVKRRRRRGDRYDGRRLKTLDPFSQCHSLYYDQKNRRLQYFSRAASRSTQWKNTAESCGMKGYPGLGVLHMFIATYNSHRVPAACPEPLYFPVSGSLPGTTKSLVSLAVKKELTDRRGRKRHQGEIQAG